LAHGLEKNADGSMDDLFGPKARREESNWVPTSAEDNSKSFRLYGPEKPLFDKTMEAAGYRRCSKRKEKTMRNKLALSFWP